MRTGGLVTAGAPVELGAVGTAMGLEVGPPDEGFVDEVTVGVFVDPVEVELVATAEEEVEDPSAGSVEAAAELVVVLEELEAGGVDTLTGPPTGVPGAGATLPVYARTGERRAGMFASLYMVASLPAD